MIKKLGDLNDKEKVQHYKNKQIKPMCCLPSSLVCALPSCTKLVSGDPSPLSVQTHYLNLQGTTLHNYVTVAQATGAQLVGASSCTPKG